MSVSHYFPHEIFQGVLLQVLNRKTQGINLQKVQNIN